MLLYLHKRNSGKDLLELLDQLYLEIFNILLSSFAVINAWISPNMLSMQDCPAFYICGWGFHMDNFLYAVARQF